MTNKQRLNLKFQILKQRLLHTEREIREYLNANDISIFTDNLTEADQHLIKVYVKLVEATDLLENETIYPEEWR